jgi:hypothetical protein
MATRRSTAKHIVGTLLLGACASGCSLFAPDKLWKLNRHPPLDRDDAYFSIPTDRLTPEAGAGRRPTESTESTPPAGRG